MAKGDDIESRLIEFAVRIVKLSDSLSKTYAGRHLANQLLCSGPSAAANYAEARGAESSKDFVHKLKICLKELNESSVWLRTIANSDLLAETRMTSIMQECSKLTHIVNASINTAKANAH